VLSITCDNASNNNVIVSKLEDMLDGFSNVNHMWCFLHITNLIVQMFIHQFDAPKPPKSQVGLPMIDKDDPNYDLYNITLDGDLEELQT
ncbi:hypothetical protein BDQ17DRAFT_1492582, partial [Cyathus striatus]